MDATLRYQLTHATGTVELTLDTDRFVVKTKGNGLIDALRTIDLPVADLRLFAVTPTIAAQTMQGTAASRTVDTSRSAELVFSYDVAGRLEQKRAFVDADDPSFQAIVNRLVALRPDASLMHLPPDEAYAKIGVVSPKNAVLVVVAVIVGVPILIAIVATLISALG